MSWLTAVIRKLNVKKNRPRRKQQKLHDSLDYLDAYAAYTDVRVAEEGPHAAVGGKWEEMGQLQFDFLLKNKLKPSNSLLDIGCGTLRAGRHFIRYLDAGQYTGFDLSLAAVNYARGLVAEEGLKAKTPTLFVNTEKNLRFERLSDRTFDYILAQSVFTHLPKENIVECMAHVSKIMDKRSVFFFTFNEGDVYAHTQLQHFIYPFSFLCDAAKNAGLSLTRRLDYEHPRGQVMVQANLL